MSAIRFPCRNVIVGSTPQKSYCGNFSHYSFWNFPLAVLKWILSTKGFEVFTLTLCNYTTHTDCFNLLSKHLMFGSFPPKKNPRLSLSRLSYVLWHEACIILSIRFNTRKQVPVQCIIKCTSKSQHNKQSYSQTNISRWSHMTGWVHDSHLCLTILWGNWASSNAWLVWKQHT